MVVFESQYSSPGSDNDNLIMFRIIVRVSGDPQRIQLSVYPFLSGQLDEWLNQAPKERRMGGFIEATEASSHNAGGGHDR